ncbi:MAG: hypothetical protein MJ033_07665 [Victivallaceae bacterium]|nr:hypothetical protein [Victivallaceae bacterium]
MKKVGNLLAATLLGIGGGTLFAAKNKLPDPPKWTVDDKPISFAAKLVSTVIDGHHFVSARTHFNDLPKEFQDCYDKELVEMRGMREYNHEIEYFDVDFDGDGVAERILFDGNCGSGGCGWLVFQKIDGKWCEVDNVFGSPGFMHHGKKVGVVIGHQLGCQKTAATYYELENHKLVPLVGINIFRESGDWNKPTAIEIKYLRDNIQ